MVAHFYLNEVSLSPEAVEHSDKPSRKDVASSARTWIQSNISEQNANQDDIKFGDLVPSTAHISALGHRRIIPPPYQENMVSGSRLGGRL